MTITPTASPELPDLDHLEALARAADQGEGQHIYTNPRDSNGWQANEAWHLAASPAAVLDLIALARRAQPEGEAPQAEPVARVIAGEWGKKVAFLANGKDAPKVGTLLYTHPPAATLSPLCGAQPAESGKETAQLSIGFANNDQGVHVSVMQQHAGGAVTLLHQVKVPAGDSFTRFAVAAQQAAAPTWGAVHTVGDMVRNLLTLDQAAPIFTAFHVTIDGERRCRTREVIISKERVVDGKWIDSARKDVPYTHIIWAKPDERVEQATALGTLPGWKLVPVEPTVDMVTHGFESEPDEFFSPGEDWDAYAEMTGCQKAAHRARLCYSAMLAAAPAALGNSPEIPDGSTSATGIPEAPKDERKGIELWRATLRACGELPEGYEVRIELENGCGMAVWYDAEGERHVIDGDGYLSDDVNEAVDAAIQRAAQHDGGQGDAK